MASSPEQETRLCGNCKRDIPLVNFTMHEVHCRRNISLCPKCKEPFPTTEMEEHEATEHSLVTCKCKMVMEKNALEEHEHASCPLRLLQCQFCDLELAFNKLGDHEEYCGARTERCDACGSSVMTKDLKDHPAVCGKVPDPKKPAKATADYEGAWFDNLQNRNTFTKHMFSQVPKHVPSRFYGRSVLTRSMKTSNEEVTRNRRREPRTENRYEDIPDDLLAEFLKDDSTSRTSHLYAPSHHRISLENKYEDIPDDLLAEFLGDDSSLRTSHTSAPFHHQSNTAFSIERDSSSNTRDSDFWMDAYSTANVRHSRDLNNFSHELIDDPPQPSLLNASASEEPQLPCEFCEELFPMKDFLLHQSGCRLPSVTSDRKSSRNSIPDNQRSTSPPVNTSQSVLIPCEFCGIALEAEILFHHQDQCEMSHDSEKASTHTPALPSSEASNLEEEYTNGPHGLSTADWSRPVYRREMQSGSTKLFTRTETASKPPRPARTSILASDQYRPRRIVNHLSAHQSSQEEMRKRIMEDHARVVRNQRLDNPPSRGASQR
ncbi:TRAF-type zinc finger domain-containing protein 1 [Gastrophryne carolinensis]